MHLLAEMTPGDTGTERLAVCDRRCLAVEEQLVCRGFVVLKSGEDVAFAGVADSPWPWSRDCPAIVKCGVVRRNVRQGDQRVGEDAADRLFRAGCDRVELPPEMRALLRASSQTHGSTCASVPGVRLAFANPVVLGLQPPISGV